MKFDYALASALMGVSIAFVQPQIAIALSSTEVSKVAKAITVLIDNPSGSGTGVIIQREGDTYTVLTAKHVIETEDKYEIVTPDGQRYPLDYKTVKKLPEVDLAVVQFTSNQSYTVAKIGNSDEAIEGATAYVAGFPKATAVISNSIYNFVAGQITANASKPLRDGYALVYSNDTLPGMSGGPVLNDKGEVVGIHGMGDTMENFQISDQNPNIIIKTGFNLGVPINTFLRLSANTKTDVGVSPPATPTATAPKADDFFIQAEDKYDKGDYQGAIADYTRAININPNLAQAYYRLGLSRSKSGNNQKAVEDLQKATELFAAQGKKADAIRIQGVARSLLKDYKGAIAALTEAIRLNVKDTLAYNNRGNARSNLGDLQGAIADYSQALNINPNYIQAYINRGNTRSASGDKHGAIADYNQALKLNPNYALAYNNRGIARTALGDLQGAISDYNEALKINPNYANVYYSRGIARSNLEDLQGAISDYNQALKINPNLAQAYYSKGIVRAALGDKQWAIADLQKAANLFQEQGKTEDYQKVLELIKKL
ncbi:tetratricopeptide repeat protein [Komarekiella sp. 'clone 1']|uniref:Serine protease n=1 Tax=Komarekiella delphini-convector SJRDD-AB1 TaxID=2593771 RepID=A0AA40VT82_9NOST|nr:serine protease [Komarekiella delphini-convector]MBD6618927.1 tetratricopeptide repeat protein [Komarekiella delphini-convector SJRDD-AB1]